MALQDARGAIEQRSLFIPEDRMILLKALKDLEKELLHSDQTSGSNIVPPSS